MHCHHFEDKDIFFWIPYRNFLWLSYTHHPISLPTWNPCLYIHSIKTFHNFNNYYCISSQPSFLKCNEFQSIHQFLICTSRKSNKRKDVNYDTELEAGIGYSVIWAYFVMHEDWLHFLTQFPFSLKCIDPCWINIISKFQQHFVVYSSRRLPPEWHFSQATYLLFTNCVPGTSSGFLKQKKTPIFNLPFIYSSLLTYVNWRCFDEISHSSKF